MSKTAREILHENRLLSSYWGRRIVKAEEQSRFTEKDVRHSASWQTCACGRQDDRIPRDDREGAPIDEDLQDLGYAFYSFVLQHNPRGAANVLVKIERRAAEVLREVTQ
jgi:hypothetical protein